MNNQSVYPDDWIKLTLDDTANYFVDGDWIEAEFIGKEGTRIIQTGNIGIGSYLDKKENAKYIDSISFKKLNCKKVFPGDLLICRLADPIGRCCIVPDFQNYYVTAVDVAIYRPKKNANKVFMMYLLNSKEKLKEMADKAGGSTRQRIARLNLGKISITIPKDIKEQEKVAEILSITDDAIIKTKQLIAKYKSIKQGLMQDLFKYGIDDNGQIRSEKTHKFKDSPLGRIPVEWEMTSLLDVVKSHDNKRVPLKEEARQQIRGVYPYYGASGIIDWIYKYKFDGEYLLLAEDGENILSRNLPISFIAKGKFWVNNHAHVFEPNKNMDILFLKEFLETLNYAYLNTSSAQPKLTASSCSKIQILKPSKQEQERIATVLRTNDKTVENEQIYLDKLKSIKTGLMQDLLTGKVRVKHLLN